MVKNVKHIGISGGTFNPIHNGHLIIAEQVRQLFNLDEVLFIPCGVPPHKDSSKVTDAHHRFSMVREATQSNPYFKASDIEIKRDGYTYTVDTLLQLRDLYGDDVKLYYIIGADVVHDILTWRNFTKVFEICEFIAALRPGFDKRKFFNEIESLKNHYQAVIHPADVPLIEISSTTIRERIKNHCTIKYLVPESVEAYIIKNSLYGI